MKLFLSAIFLIHAFISASGQKYDVSFEETVVYINEKLKNARSYLNGGENVYYSIEVSSNGIMTISKRDIRFNLIKPQHFRTLYLKDICYTKLYGLTQDEIKNWCVLEFYKDCSLMPYKKSELQLSFPVNRCPGINLSKAFNHLIDLAKKNDDFINKPKDPFDD